MVVTILFLSVVGAVSSILLFTVAKQFKVEEDPRIDEVNAVLPQANCGGCGYPGCTGFAKACVDAETMDGLFCTVGGNETMAQVADILGRTVKKEDPKVAVVRCNGTCENRPRLNHFDGIRSCAIAAQLYGGETGCSWGCYGMGDCTLVCDFDAIHMDTQTGLPKVDDEKCTACGACVKACPKMIIQLRKKGRKNRRIYVACMNQEKGPVAKKSCAVSCIGCGMCAKQCEFEAITITNNLAYIDDTKCRQCRKCAPVCPTSAIHEENFPLPKKVAQENTEMAQA